MKDKLKHCIIFCDEGKQIWEWAKQYLVMMLLTVPSRIPDGWITCPQFTLWPLTRHPAVLWLLASLLVFRTQQPRDLTLQDFIDFLKWTRWKLYQLAEWHASVGYFLSTVETIATEARLST
jgi:hypothetical protein